MPTFEIPDGPTTIDASRSAEGSAVYSVTNTTSDTVDGRLGVRVSGASRDEWFTVDGNRERTFGPGETQTATIRVRLPADAPEGTYPFQLRAVAVNDPDNDHAEGPMTIARLGPGGGKTSLLWLWILLGVLAVAAIAAGIYFLMPADKPDAPPPPPPPPQAPAALDTAQALRLAEKKTAAWFSASSRADVDTLVSLSPPPFYFDQAVLIDESQIRSRYNEIRSSERRVAVDDARPVEENEASLSDETPTREVKIEKMMAYTIGDLRKEKPEYLQNDRVLNAMKLGDDDIAVPVIFVGGEGAIFFFRRSARDVEMAGFWD